MVGHLPPFVCQLPPCFLAPPGALVWLRTYSGGAVPLHPHVLLPEEAQPLPTLMRMILATMHLFKLSGEQRSQLLRFMNNYYKLHIPNFAELKSLKVLQEVFA